MRRTLLLGSALALVLAATSSIALASSSRGGPPSKGGPRGDVPQAFADCMQAQGVTRPERGSGPPSAAEREKRQAAFEKCKQHLPDAVRKAIEARHAFGDCMRAKGFVPPERGSRPSAAEREQRRAAAKACAAQAGIELGPRGRHGKGFRR